MCVIDSVSVPFTRIVNHPQHKSICYHPSLLPRHRGASAINWTLMEGDRKGGFSIFWADDGLDTGPLLLQKECYIGENDTVDSVYNGFMYPVGEFFFRLHQRKYLSWDLQAFACILGRKGQTVSFNQWLRIKSKNIRTLDYLISGQYLIRFI